MRRPGKDRNFQIMGKKKKKGKKNEAICKDRGGRDFIKERKTLSYSRKGISSSVERRKLLSPGIWKERRRSNVPLVRNTGEKGSLRRGSSITKGRKKRRKGTFAAEWTRRKGVRGERRNLFAL